MGGDFFSTLLGGSLDATNVVPASVAVLTNIGLDHTEILGDSIEEIASDKAGIIKPGQMVISGIRHDGARRIVARRCQAQRAELWQIGQSFDYERQGESKFTLSLPSLSLEELGLEMKGHFQLANASCAAAAVEALPGCDVSETAIRDGLRKARVPGRMEVVQQNPTVILDGAHNPDKMEAASQAPHDCYEGKRRIVVLSLKSDKAADEYRTTYPK